MSLVWSLPFDKSVLSSFLSCLSDLLKVKTRAKNTPKKLAKLSPSVKEKSARTSPSQF